MIIGEKGVWGGIVCCVQTLIPTAQEGEETHRAEEKVRRNAMTGSLCWAGTDIQTHQL